MTKPQLDRSQLTTTKLCESGVYQQVSLLCFFSFSHWWWWWWVSCISIFLCFPGGTSGKEPTCWCRRHRRPRFDPWVRKIPYLYLVWPTQIGPLRVFHRILLGFATNHTLLSPLGSMYRYWIKPLKWYTKAKNNASAYFYDQIHAKWVQICFSISFLRILFKEVKKTPNATVMPMFVPNPHSS